MSTIGYSSVPLLQQLYEVALESDWDRIPIDLEAKQWLREYPLRTGSSLIVGPYNITDRKNRARYIYRDHYPVPPGEMAMVYLKGLGIEDLSRDVLRDVGKPPLYFVGLSSGNFAYIDIKACYFSLYRCMTLDMVYTETVYRPGSYIFERTEELALDKRIRNNVFGITEKSRVTRYRDGNWSNPIQYSNAYRPSLAQYVFDTVQAIAQEAVKLFNVKMWLTDAAIIDMNEEEAFQEWLRKEWLLDSKVEARGPSTLLQQNVYKVDKKIGGKIEHYIDLKHGKTDNFYPVNIQRLKEIRYHAKAHSALSGH